MAALSLPLLGLLLGWALAIAVIDWRQRRVPNVGLLALLLPAVAVLAWRGSGLLAVGWLDSVVGFAAGLLITLPGYAMSRLGAGDVKLAAVLGLVLGWPQLGWLLLGAGLLLGGMAAAAVWWFGFANARTLRLPAAVALCGAFAGLLLAQYGGWQ